MKNVQFLHPPPLSLTLSSFSVCSNESELGGTPRPRPWRLKLDVDQPPLEICNVEITVLTSKSAKN